MIMDVGYHYNVSGTASNIYSYSIGMMVGGMGGTEGAMTAIGTFTSHPSLKGTVTSINDCSPSLTHKTISAENYNIDTHIP